MDIGLVNGLLNILTPQNVLYALLGSVAGTLVGVLPGLGPAATLAILFPISLYLPADGAIILMSSIYYGAMYGGSTTAILVNIPGEVAAVPTALDGFQMTKQGRAGEALAIAAIGSFIAGTFGALMVGAIGPLLADVALHFGPAEYVGLIFFSLTSLVSLAGKSLIKGLIAGLAGILLAAVGMDPLTGTLRLTFGKALLPGFDLVAMVIGLFGIAEMLANVRRSEGHIFQGTLGSWVSMIPRGVQLTRGLVSSARATVLGFFLGILPGMSPGLTSFIAYDAEKRMSRHPEQFGAGAIEGVAAPEAANNATAMGGFVPLLSLGIPTNLSLAIMLGVLVMHGLQPGPLLFQEDNALFTWTVIASMYLGNVILLVLNLPLVGMWARLSLIPLKYMVPLILGICVVGAYSARGSMFDVFVAIMFGLFGYAMRALDWPMVPLVLGFILGSLGERALRQALTISDGSVSAIVERPIALGLILAGIAALLLMAYVRRRSTTVAAVMLEQPQ